MSDDNNKMAPKPTSKANIALSPERLELILLHRTSALKIAYRLTHVWGSRINLEELPSIVDYALCLAAMGYSGKSSAGFLTYAFYFIKGEMCKFLRANSKFTSLEDEAGDCKHSSQHEVDERKLSSTSCPEMHTLRGQLNRDFQDALKSMSTLEQTLIFRCALRKEKIADIAKDLGYSRAHLSTIYNSSLRSLGQALQTWKEAA